MNLDNQRIAIRERGIFEIMDLSLHVLRWQIAPLAVSLVVCAVPMIFLNQFLLSDTLSDELEAEEFLAPGYIYYLLLLTAVQAPIVTAPATLLLGRATFGGENNVVDLLKDLLRCAPQFVLFQIIGRALSVLLCFTVPLLPYVGWPFLGEIILLERNSLLRGRQKRLTTMKRTIGFHSGVFNEILSRWFASLLIGGLLIGSSWMTLWVVLSHLTGGWHSLHTTYAWYLPIALWMTIGFFTVVRFLSYLDLRIRREGWEVELAVRAEGARLSTALGR